MDRGAIMKYVGLSGALLAAVLLAACEKPKDEASEKDVAPAGSEDVDKRAAPEAAADDEPAPAEETPATAAEEEPAATEEEPMAVEEEVTEETISVPPTVSEDAPKLPHQGEPPSPNQPQPVVPDEPEAMLEGSATTEEEPMAVE